MRLDEKGKLDLEGLGCPVRFQFKMPDDVGAAWKIFKDLGPARGLTNDMFFSGIVAVLMEGHPWTESLSDRVRVEIGARASSFRAWWEMSGGLPGDFPLKFGSSNQVSAPIRPGRSNEPNEEWHQAFEREIEENTKKLEARNGKS